MDDRQSLLRMFEKRQAHKPRYTFGFRLPGRPDAGFMEILPLEKSWPAIIFIALFLAAFSIPYFAMDFGFSGTDDLFELTSNLFMLFWFLGWSVGVLAIALLLLAMLFAREVLIVDKDGLRLRMEILNLGFEARLPETHISNLRYVSDNSIGGAKWRGRHLAVDYLGVPVSFGSDLDNSDALALISRINHTLAKPVPGQPTESIKAMMATPIPNTDGAPPVPKIAQSDTAVSHQSPALGKRSFYLLVIANLVPLAGAFLLGWSVGDIMLLFWMESAIVGFFNILKMFRIAGAMAIFSSIFFCAHYGAFMAVHLMFLFSLFINPEGSSLAEVATVFRSLWVAVLALFISHGFSFFDNFLGRKEYERLSISQQMHKPYVRVITMHITIIFGGFLVLALNMPTLALVLLIVLKVVADGKAHLKEHQAA